MGWKVFGRRRGFSFRKFFSADRLVGLALLAVFAAVAIVDPYPIEYVRTKTFDTYQKYRPRTVTERPVTIVDIDEESLKEIGQWPWPRTTLAQIVANLFNAGAAVVAFDVVFAEPDRMSPAQVAKSVFGLDDEMRAKLAAMPSNDDLFADLLKQTAVQVKVGNRVEEIGRVVAGQAVLFTSAEAQGAKADANPPPPKSVAWRGLSKEAPPPAAFLPAFHSLVRNVPEIEDAAGGHGIFSLMPEPDGTVRRVPTYFVNGDKYFPTLPVEILRLAMQQKTAFLMTDLDGIQEVRIRNPQGGFFSIPTDGEGRVWPYFSPRDFAKYVPARDVLNGTVEAAKVAGKIVLVGTSATGLLDIRSTPVDQFLPGVEVHAQFIEAVMTKELLSRPSDMQAIEFGVLMAVGLLLVILIPWIGARWTLGLFLVVAGGMAGASWYQFTEHRHLLDATFAVGATLLIYTAMTYMGFSREEAQKQRVRSAFGHYLSPAMVERLAEDPSQLKLGGEKRDMTMLFCDVRGFTTISETFKANPEGLTRLINRLLTPLTRVILERRGTVDKYMGDCIMAFWNAPLDDPEHAANACRSALVMLAEMGPLNEALAAEAAQAGRAHMPLRIGVGVNSGDVVVGNMGSDMRFDYSVLGDAVNLASRLEGQSKNYGVDCVIGEATWARVPDFATLELDLIKVKGKKEAVAVYTLVGDETAAATDFFRSLRDSHEAMIRTYRAQDWRLARERLEDCRRKIDGFNLSGFYDLYEERIRLYQETPPGEAWDGVFVATSK